MLQAELFPNPPEGGDLTWEIQDDPIDEHANSTPNENEADDNSFGLLALDVSTTIGATLVADSMSNSGLSRVRATFFRRSTTIPIGSW
jgi:hypothetical protein